MDTSSLVNTPQYLETPTVLSVAAFKATTRNGTYPRNTQNTAVPVEEEVGPGKKNGWQAVTTVSAAGKSRAPLSQLTVLRAFQTASVSVPVLNAPVTVAKVTVPANQPAVNDCTGAGCADPKIPVVRSPLAAWLALAYVCPLQSGVPQYNVGSPSRPGR
jgi:hypothetical protein